MLKIYFLESLICLVKFKKKQMNRSLDIFKIVFIFNYISLMSDLRKGLFTEKISIGRHHFSFIWIFLNLVKNNVIEKLLDDCKECVRGSR